MDYVNEFYCIYAIIINYDMRKTVFLAYISYDCNE